jgi:hypothetical protein
MPKVRIKEKAKSDPILISTSISSDDIVRSA